MTRSRHEAGRNLAVQRTWRGVKSSEAEPSVASPAVVAVVVKLT